MVANKGLWILGLSAAGLFILYVALIEHQTVLYVMGLSLIGMPYISYCIGRLLSSGVSCKRRIPAAGDEGDRIRVVIEMTNRSRLPKLYVAVSDELGPWLRVSDPAPRIAVLGPGESAEVVYELELLKRGVHKLGPMRVEVSDPLGFWRFVALAEEDLSRPDIGIVTLPRVYPLQSFMEQAAGAWGRLEQRTTNSRDSGLDFQGVRAFRPGDELRRVHWRTTARTGQLAVMEFGQSVGSDVTLVVDRESAGYADTGEGTESAYEYAARIAASIGCYLMRNGYAVQWIDSVKGAAMRFAGAHETAPFLAELAFAEPSTDASLMKSLDTGLGLGGVSRSLILITPRLDNPALAHSLSQYRANGIGVFCFLIDAGSFAAKAAADRSPLGPKGETTPGWIGSGVQIVKKGSNLVSLLEGAPNVGTA